MVFNKSFDVDSACNPANLHAVVFVQRAADKEVLQECRLLIWQTGLSYPTLDATDRAFLTDHLDNGGNLFLTGQDIGWELNYASSGNYDPTWYHTYLHANYVTDDTNR